MARSTKTNRSRQSRKPVTIDLEAQAIETDEDIAGKIPDDIVSENEAEPVAFENIESADDTGPTQDANDTSDVSNDADDSNAFKEKVTPAPAAVSAKRGSALTGGLIGGLLALIGGAGLQWTGILPSFGGGSAQEQVDLTPLQSQIDALKTDLLQINERDTALGTPDPATLSAAVEAAQSASKEALDGLTGVRTNFDELTAKVNQIESTVSSGGAGESAGLETLTNRLAALEVSVSEKISALPTAGDFDITSKLAPIEEKLTTFGTQISEIEQNVEAKFTALDARIADTDSKVGEASGSASVAIAIAAAGLKSAIDRGGSFMAELEAYSTVAEDISVVDELRNYAASGVPTINQLADQFPSVANQIVATGQGLSQDASMADRLMASARSLVQVRPVGEVVGDTPGAIAARVENRLKDSNLAGALVEFETLPDAAKQVAGQFADNMRARQAVDALVAKALTGAMAATAPQAN